MKESTTAHKEKQFQILLNKIVKMCTEEQTVFLGLPKVHQTSTLFFKKQFSLYYFHFWENWRVVLSVADWSHTALNPA